MVDTVGTLDIAAVGIDVADGARQVKKAPAIGTDSRYRAPGVLT